MKEIPLTKGYVALVDDEDYERVAAHQWHARKSDKTYYACGRIRDEQGRRVTVQMSRFILRIDRHDPTQVDHRDHNGLNNQKYNLRPASPSQNVCHRRVVGGSSRFKGVAWNKQMERWEAGIKVQGKKFFVGFYYGEVEAALAYDRAAHTYHGEFAVYNFADDRQRLQGWSHEPAKARRSSQFAGVGWAADRKRWRAFVRAEKKLTYIGNFEREEDAAKAYDDYVVKAGLDRKLNFPGENNETAVRN